MSRARGPSASGHLPTAESQDSELLQREVDRLSRKLQDSEDEHKSQVQLFQRQIEELNAKRHSLLQRTDAVAKLESELVNLYLEIEDRSFVERDRDFSKDREELRKVPALTVLDYLRASLRTLLTFKEDFESELVSRVERRKRESADALEVAEERIAELEAENQVLTERMAHQEQQFKAGQQKVEAALQQARLLEDRVTGLTEERDQAVQRMTASEKEFESRIKVLEQELSRAALKDRQIEKLIAEKEALHAQHQTMVTKLRGSQRHIIDSFQRELRDASTVAAQNRRLEQKLVEKDRQLASYRRNVVLARKEESERETQRLQREVEERSAEISRLEQQLRSETQKNRTLVAQLSKLQQEYGRAFDVISKGRVGQTSAIDAAEKRADEASLETELVRSALVDKTREAAELQKTVRQLAVQKNRNLMASMARQSERRKVQRQFSRLRRDLSIASSPSRTTTKASPSVARVSSVSTR